LYLEVVERVVQAENAMKVILQLPLVEHVSTENLRALGF
jgi:hypothetical protein